MFGRPSRADGNRPSRADAHGRKLSDDEATLILGDDDNSDAEPGVAELQAENSNLIYTENLKLSAATVDDGHEI